MRRHLVVVRQIADTPIQTPQTSLDQAMRLMRRIAIMA
jgi:hypothetical protein